MVKNPNAAKLTKEEFLAIIDNYRNNGRDTTELEKTLEEAFPNTVEHKHEIPTIDVDAKIAELRKQSSVTEGSCSICGAKGYLLGGVCETCFLPWATKVAKDNVAKEEKNKRREKF